MTTHTRRKSTKLSWLLRHGAIEAGLAMDPAGWADIRDVRRATGLSAASLDAIVADNNKTRFEVEGTRIRASQGHSADGVPVEADALEASWSTWEDDASIWHGTNVNAVAGIAATGINAGRRTHVHLAATTGSRVGKRANVHVLLEIAPARLRDAGQRIYVSPNGVVLVRHVPASCIVGLRTLTRRARADDQRLRGLFNLNSVGNSPTGGS